ncbi:MAG: serine hydrolase domain-containing protein [Candidatus Binataceae bacterium]
MKERFDALVAGVSDAMKRHFLPGCAIGVIADGQEFSAGLGVTSVDNPLPVDADTLFQIGSTTKTFTASAIMRLVEMGKLSLDEPVRTYLPDFVMRDPDVTVHATTRHLLTHTGGWVGDFFDDTGDGDDALEIYVRRMAELSQLTPLGSVWSYNNAAFSVAGHVIAAVTGQTYEAALKDLVLKPLGLKRSYLFPSYVMLKRFAVGHAVVKEKAYVLRPWPIPRSSWPAGGIAASAKDQLRYARFHLGDGTADGGDRVLKAETMAAMQTPVCDGALDTKMGLSWMINEMGGVRFVMHGGGTLGQLSTFMIAPERKFALVILTNAGGGEAMSETIKLALELFLDAKIELPATIEKQQCELAEYAGRYDSALDAIELKTAEEHLLMQVIPHGGFPTRDSPAGPPLPPTRIKFTAPERVIAIDPPFTGAQGEFLRGADGAISWFRYGGRVHGPQLANE